MEGAIKIFGIDSVIGHAEAVSYHDICANRKLSNKYD